MSEKYGLSAAVASAPSRRVAQGPVMPIGGAEETKPGGQILERFVDLAGGKKARIAIIPTASEDPQRSGEGYATLFREMGVREADWLRVERRENANAEEALWLLREATGIYITGEIRPGWCGCSSAHSSWSVSGCATPMVSSWPAPVPVHRSCRLS